MSDTPISSAEMRNDSEPSNFWRHPLWIVILVGLAVRLYSLGGLSFWYDEATSFLGADYVDWKLTFLTASESRLTPVFAVMTLMWTTICENILGITMGSVASDFFMRLLPTAFSIALIYLTYRLSIYLYGNRRAALIAAWFIALSPFHVYYAQEYRPHTLYAFLVTLAMYISLRALEDGGKKYWFATVFVSTLAFYAYYFSVFFFIGFNVYALSCFSRYRSKLIPWTLSQLAILALIIPPVLMALTVWNMHTAAEEHWFPHPTLKTALLTLKNLFAGYSFNIPLYWALFFLGSGIIGLGLFEMRKTLRQMRFLVCLSAVPILAQIALWATQDFAFYTYRIQLAYTAPIFILMGIGISSISKNAGRVAIVGLFTALTIPALADVYRQNLHPVWDHVIGARYKVDSRSAAHLVKEKWQSSDVLTHSSTFTYAPFRHHYFKNEDQGVLAFTDDEYQLLLKSYPDEKAWATIGFIPERIENLIAGKDRVWFIQSFWLPFDQSPLMYEFREWLDAHALRLEQHRFFGIQVYLYDLTTTPHAQEHRYRRLHNGRNHIDGNWQKKTDSAEDDFEFLLEESFPLLFELFPEDSLEITNTSDVAFTITQNTFSSIESIPAIAFDRDGNSNVWRPSSSYDGQPAMQAKVNEEQSSTLTLSTYLPGGKMNVLIRVFNSGDIDQESSAASLTVEIEQAGTQKLTAEVVIIDQPGWNWINLGEINCISDNTKITVVASTDSKQLPAQVEWERIAFVDSTQVESYLKPISVTLEAPGNQTTRIQLDISEADTTKSHRIDYEFRDEDENGYTLYYYR